ncbi:hypothetical protein [Massilia sp. 9096]|uniref:hypothetical protein n=1 Tax=Massilia sp. 9096 TaxID=1500894 RepID=UPI00055D3E19|nr:hypothetical protein [Massilia sp. 9096]
MAANKHTGPRRGSWPYRALGYLHMLGQESLYGWMQESSYEQSARDFQYEVVERLLSWHLVELVNESYRVTSAGRSYLGIVDAAAAVGDVATSRQAAPQRPLSTQNRPALRVMRPGALHYRDIPSRLGDQVIPHGKKAAA